MTVGPSTFICTEEHLKVELLQQSCRWYSSSQVARWKAIQNLFILSRKLGERLGKSRRFSDQNVFLNAVDQGLGKGILTHIRSGLLEVGLHTIYRSNILKQVLPRLLVANFVKRQVRHGFHKNFYSALFPFSPYLTLTVFLTDMKFTSVPLNMVSMSFFWKHLKVLKQLSSHTERSLFKNSLTLLINQIIRRLFTRLKTYSQNYFFTHQTSTRFAEYSVTPPNHFVLGKSGQGNLAPYKRLLRDEYSPLSRSRADYPRYSRKLEGTDYIEKVLDIQNRNLPDEKTIIIICSKIIIIKLRIIITIEILIKVLKFTWTTTYRVETYFLLPIYTTTDFQAPKRRLSKMRRTRPKGFA